MLAPRHLVLALCALAAWCSEEVPSEELAREVLGSISDPQTLSQLLQWSLNHSDLDALHAKAEAIRAEAGDVGSSVLSAEGNVGEVIDSGSVSEQKVLPAPADVSTEQRTSVRVEASAESFAARREELSALSAKMFPNQVEIMKSVMRDALNASLELDVREEALLALQELVEDLDNAKDFMAIGGFKQVMELLGSETPALVAGVAWIVGTAVQNQRELQLQMLELHLMAPLLQLLHAHTAAEVRTKALYALSGLLRNCAEAQLQFKQGEGVGVLLRTLADVSSPRLVRKALVLLTDLLAERASREDEELEGREEERSLLSTLQHSPELCEAVLGGLRVPDVDTQEKAVEALQSMLTAGVELDSSAAEGCSSAAMLLALQGFIAQAKGGEGSDEVLALAQRLEAMLVSAQLS